MDKKRTVRTSQIIAGALIAGVVVFGIVAFGIARKKPPEENILSYIAVGVTVVELMLRLVVPGIVANTLVGRLKKTQGGNLDPAQLEAHLCNAFQTMIIVDLALIEGAAFLVLVAYLITAQWWLLAVAGGLVVLIVLSFPNQSKLDFWLENKLQELF